MWQSEIRCLSFLIFRSFASHTCLKLLLSTSLSLNTFSCIGSLSHVLFVERSNKPTYRDRSSSYPRQTSWVHLCDCSETLLRGRLTKCFARTERILGRQHLKKRPTTYTASHDLATMANPALFLVVLSMLQLPESVGECRWCARVFWGISMSTTQDVPSIPQRSMKSSRISSKAITGIFVLFANYQQLRSFTWTMD